MQAQTTESNARVVAGPVMLVVNAALFVGAVALLVVSAPNGDGEGATPAGLAAGGLLLIAAILAALGFFVVQPNHAKVIVLFGRYVGTTRDDGWHWTNPFTVGSRKTISLRARNFDSEQVKVNDARGNPIQIAAVVVWRVVDPARAVFDVEDYVRFVAVQSETAVRHVASQYPYDSYEDGAHSLSGNVDEVCESLKLELHERLAHAGVEVLEARLSHLSYAPEIAGAMLRRQQATAVVAARQTMVEGAVGMVQHALAMLSEQNVVELDEERKAAMISNLLVVLTGEQAAHPVVNAGSLY